MSYLALYRKYRPKSFDEMVGQNNVIRVIKNAVMNNKVSHAYLFSGPRGTGKTTTAKIIAKMVNCENLVDGEPCGKCPSCLNILNSSDVIEIDAASNNGVDEIRNLRDKVNLVPSENKYKIYIIDEVHMLTIQAFNALLKTLEEPPQHVIFILATTEFHKIPMTIVSRCQKFQFTKISDDDMVNNLRRIAVSENINVDNSILYEISRLSDGCCRDAVNLFDQLISYSNGDISIDQLYEISGSISYMELYEVLHLINNKKSLEIIKFCSKINQEGKNIFKFVEELLVFIKDIISFKFGIDDIKIAEKREKIGELSKLYSCSSLYYMIDELNELLNKIKISTYPSILLNVCLLKLVDNSNDNRLTTNNDNENNLTKTNANTFATVKNDKKSSEFISKKSKDSELTFETNEKLDNNKSLNDDDINLRINNVFVGATKEYLADYRNKWKNIDDYLVKFNCDYLSSILKDCMPVVASDNYLIVSAKYASVINRFNENYVAIESLLKNIFEREINVVAISDDKWNVEKNKYIANIKNGVKYQLKPLISNLSMDILKESKTNEESKKNDVDILKDLLGNDIIKYV